MLYSDELTEPYIYRMVVVRLFSPAGATSNDGYGSTTQPQLVGGRAVEPTHPASAPQAAAAAAAPAAGWKPVATMMSTSQGLRGAGRGREDVDGSTAGHSSSRSDSTDDVDVDVDGDGDGIGDESSTASGTSVAEEGWESGHGLDNEEVEAAGLGLDAVGKGEGVGGGALPAAVRKRNSFRRAFDKARWVHRDKYSVVLVSVVHKTRSLVLCATSLNFR